MNGSGSTVGGNKIGRRDAPCLMLSFTRFQFPRFVTQSFIVVVKGRHITLADQFTAHERRFDFQFPLQFGSDRFDQIFGQDDILIQFWIVGDGVFDRFIDCRKLIRRQSPRRRGPDQQAGGFVVSRLVDQRKEYEHRWVFDRLITLPYLAGA